MRAVAALDDPVGEELEHRKLASGLDLRKVRVPLGVVAVVYEARPNVTVDCAALTIKSGNAIVLRGSSYAERTNGALAALAREALAEAGLPEDAVLLLPAAGREDLAELATQEGVVDLLIPRGGEGLKAALKEVATVPVMYAAAGNCHVYVHADADLEMARRIAYNAKVQRPGVCNAAETLLVDAAVAERFLPGASSPTCVEAGVELVGDERARELAGEVEVGAASDAGLGHRVPRPEDGGRRRRLARGGDRAHQRATAPATRRRSSPPPRRPPSASPPASTPPSSTSTPRPVSPTASSSGWAPRSATRPRSCTRAGRSACAS